MNKENKKKEIVIVRIEDDDEPVLEWGDMIGAFVVVMAMLPIIFSIQQAKMSVAPPQPTAIEELKVESEGLLEPIEYTEESSEVEKEPSSDFNLLWWYRIFLHH